MPTQPLDILVVEDNAADARLIQILLHEGQFGPHVIRTADTLAAAIARATERRPDLIVLDPGLPDSPPERTLNALRAAHGLKLDEVPTVVMSGHEDHAAGLRALREGAQDYLVKGTLDADRLTRAIRYSLERALVQRQLVIAQRERFRAVQLQSQVLNALPAEVAVLDTNGVVIGVNGAWRACMRDGRSDAPDAECGVGRRYADVMRAAGLSASAGSGSPAAESRDASVSLELIEQGIGDVLAHRLPVFSIEYLSFMRTRPRWYRLVAKAMRADEFDGAIVLHLDITDRVTAEESLRQSAANYRFLFEQASTLSVVVNPDGTVRDINEWFLREAQLTKETTIGRHVLEFVLPEQRETVGAVLARALAGETTPAIEVGIVGGDDRVIWVLFSPGGVRLEGDRDRPGTLFTAIDVTQRREAEAALRQADDRLRFAQKMEAVGLLASGVAHDFNNLLTAIRGYTSLARSDLGDSVAVGGALDHVEEAARQASGVASALLTFARKVPTSKSSVEIAPVVEIAARLFRRTLPPSIRFEVEVDGAPDYWVHGDPIQLQQIVMNLGLNARDAIDGAGLIRLRVEPGEAVFDGQTKPSVRIVVSDTGVGIPEDLQARIFEPFFTTKPREQGTGLGLAVIHGIVMEHGGLIEVNSAPGRGSTFVVTLPVVARPIGVVETKPRLPAEGGRIALVTADNQLIRGLLSSMLSTLGYEVVQAGSAAQALGLARASNRRIDLLVADARLPDSGAVELIENLRSESHAKRAVIVAARTSLDPLAQLRTELGAGDGTSDGVRIPDAMVVLSKPFQLADLQRAIDAASPDRE